MTAADPTKRFSDRVEDYVRYRPSYPDAAVDAIVRVAALSAGSVIADVGCGTGISSRPFLERNISVFGIEPNEAMRAAAAAYLSDYLNFNAIGATAENTGLDEDSVDAVIAAQAFHWFDIERTRSEFRRILRPGGAIALIWNERLLDATEFLRHYEKLLLKYATDYAEVRHDRIGPDAVGNFFDAPFRTMVFKNVQRLDLDGLIGRAASSSYMPAPATAAFDELTASLKALFANYAENGRIEIFYDTRVYISRL